MQKCLSHFKSHLTSRPIRFSHCAPRASQTPHWEPSPVMAAAARGHFLGARHCGTHLTYRNAVLATALSSVTIMPSMAAWRGHTARGRARLELSCLQSSRVPQPSPGSLSLLPGHGLFAHLCDLTLWSLGPRSLSLSLGSDVSD